MKSGRIILCLGAVLALSCKSAMVQPAPDRPVQVVMMDDIDVARLNGVKSDIGEESSPFWLAAGKTDLGVYYWGFHYRSTEMSYVFFNSQPGETWIICSGVYADGQYPSLQAFKVEPHHLKMAVTSTGDRLQICRQYTEARREAEKKKANG